jgi:hypothetical protein
MPQLILIWVCLSNAWVASSRLWNNTMKPHAFARHANAYNNKAFILLNSGNYTYRDAQCSKSLQTGNCRTLTGQPAGNFANNEQ